MNILKKIFAHAALILLAIACVILFLMVVAVSFSGEADLARYGYSLIPKSPQLTAYRYVFSNATQLFNAYKITIFVSIAGTVGGMLVMIGLAYPLSREDFIFKKQLSTFLFITMIFSGGLVPSYIWISKYLQLRDTIWVLIVPMLVNVWNVFLLRTFFKTVPKSLIESAMLDGAGEFYILMKIIIPLSKVGIATISLFTLLAYWNDWFTSMIYIDNKNLVSLQYLMYRIMENVSFFKSSSQSVQAMLGTQGIPNETVRMAICVIAAGPMIFVFPFFQKYFAKGIMVGSIKG